MEMLIKFVILFFIFIDIAVVLYFIIKAKLIRSQIRNKRIEEAYVDAQETLKDLEEMVRRRRASIDAEIREAERQQKQQLELEKQKIDFELERKKDNAYSEYNDYIASLDAQKTRLAEEQEQLKAAYQKDLEEIQQSLEGFRQRQESINEAIRRERMIAEQQDFFRIVLSKDDIADIESLMALAPRLQHRELIPKLIWDAIVARPTEEMIKRVVTTATGGIYKITYLPTGEAYIGRTTDFKKRWKNHVMTALGMEKAASSTLHTHMAAHGIQNYSFEILEEVPKEQQSEREKFYIELYNTKSQLNQKAGG